MQLYHNPRCSKSRAALALLDGKDVDIILYLVAPPSVEDLRVLCGLLGIWPAELIRRGEDQYRQLVKEHGEPNDATALAWMHQHPKLIERPILVNEGRAIIGRPPERVLEIV